MMPSLEKSGKAGSVGMQKVCTVLTLRNSEDVEDLQERMRSIEQTVGEQQRRLQELSRSTTDAGTETWRIRSSKRCAQLLPCNSVHVPKPSRRRRAVRVCMDVWLPELKGGSHMSASYAYGLERLRHRMPLARLQVQDEQLQSVNGFAQQRTLQMMHKGPTARRRPNSVEKHSPNRLLGHTTYSKKTTWSIVAEELVDIFRDPFLIRGIPLYFKSKLD